MTDFPGDPVIETLGFHCKGHDFDPWLRNEDNEYLEMWPKNNRNYILEKEWWKKYPMRRFGEGQHGRKEPPSYGKLEEGQSKTGLKQILENLRIKVGE